MLETLRNAWKVKEIRNKILFTIFIILIFRVGSVIPVPYINVSALQAANSSGATNEFFSYLSILTGGGLGVIGCQLGGLGHVGYPLH